MRTKLSKLALAATFGLALALTFSCSSDNGSSGPNGPNGPSGSNDKKEVISSATWTYVYYDANGGVSSTSTTRVEYEYDSRGNRTEQVNYAADGSISGRYEYEYDSKGNQTKQVNYKADGSISSRYEYEYDSKGNQTKQVIYAADGSISLIYEYNCNSDGSYCNYSIGNGTGEVIVYTGETRYTTVNSKKLTASETRESYDGTSTKTEYEYDSNGNITKQTTYSLQKDTGNYVKYYEITYTYTYKKL